MGTLSYLSPEQARGERVDGRSDLFALGAVLYEMLTGRRAFSAPTPSDTLVAILRDEPPPPSTLGIRLPAELGEVVRRCLEKNVERRFPSAGDLAFALSSIAREEGRSLAVAAASATAMSVAVLPFVNVSADRENEYFSDGMTEELINALAQVPGLRVAARTSSFAFKEKREDVRVIGERLGVGAVLEGSVRRAGERLRVTAQLVNTADGYQVWSENYDRDARDVFAVQEEIARAIVGQLRVRLGLGGEAIVKRYTSDPEAYNLYLRGRYFWNRRSPESMRRAAAYFEAAIARDPGYAEAYAGLADCYINRPHKDMAKGREAAERAVSLGPDLAEAHAALARAIFSFDWDWDGAEREFRKAIALNPAYAEAYHAYSHYLVPAGRAEESLVASRKALELDPLSVSMVAHLGWHYLYSGQPAEAERYSRAALEMDPDFFPARMHLGIELETAGRYAEAIAEFERARDASPGTSEALGGLGHALAAAGRREEAEAVRGAIEEIARTGYASPYDRALIDAGLGNREAAIGWLEKAAEDRTPQIVELCVDPRFANLGAEPRRAELCRRVGLMR
jgi:serine/threonine-protein kinase